MPQRHKHELKKCKIYILLLNKRTHDILLNCVCSYDATPKKTPTKFNIELEKQVLNFVWKNRQVLSEKKKKKKEDYSY